MTIVEFKAALRALGWSQSEFARKAGLTPNTSSRYANGDAAIPRWVERYLGVMQEIARLHAQYVEPDTKGPKK